MSTLESDLAAVFARYSRDVVAAYLYGSHARGNAHADSDIDTAVLLDVELLPDRHHRSRVALQIATDLIAATHCNELDVVVLNDATPELAARATQDGVRVFCRDPEVDRRFRLETQLRYIDLLPFLRRTRRIKAEALTS